MSQDFCPLSPETSKNLFEPIFNNQNFQIKTITTGQDELDRLYKNHYITQKIL